ncbi:MAG: tripartite tricarboxylate transporter substrate-binding protein [Burkholderiales bacterium]
MNVQTICSRRWLLDACAVAIVFVIMAAPAPVLAQELTGKTVRIVVPFAVGGILDVVARSYATELGVELGASTIVENRLGAGGAIATASVAKAIPDGQTLLFTGGSHNINGSLYTKLPYHPIKDFTGVALAGLAGYVVVINAGVPVQTIAELVAYAKARPGQLNYGTSGQGSAAHLSMAYLAAVAGINVVQIPMKGMNEAVGEVIAGRSHVMIAAGVAQYAKDPRVRFLATTGAERSRFLPDLPTVAEAGLAGYAFESWLGLLAPVATPRPIVDRINAGMARLLKDPVIIERFRRSSLEPRNLGPDEFNRLLREDFEKMAKVVKLSGATIQ